MSALTAEGRRRIHDNQREGAIRGLSKDPKLAGLSVHQRVTLGELKLIGRDLFRDIKRRGVILPDGEVNPAVEAQGSLPQPRAYNDSYHRDEAGGAASL